MRKPVKILVLSARLAFLYAPPVPKPNKSKKRKPEVTSSDLAVAALRTIMTDRSLTQQQVSELIRCTRSHVAMLLSGSTPSLGVAARIQREFKIPCVDWVGVA